MHSTPVRAVRKWLRSVAEHLDRAAFRNSDLDAVARDWEVRSPRLFVREYRDPRWDTVTACRGCGHRVVIGEACARCGPAGAKINPGGLVGAT